MSTDTMIWVVLAALGALVFLNVALLMEVARLRVELDNARDRIIDIWSKIGCSL